MLAYMRPHGSQADKAFRTRYLTSLPNAKTDMWGNIHVRVGTSCVLWSSHTDTVHRKSGIQHVLHEQDCLLLSDDKRSSCLGGDDTVGVFLMREMILAHVPGYYVFHYGEESGGIGSRALASNVEGTFFTPFDCAIALDRAGTGDVITHQAAERCCSDAFALSLASQLGGKYAPCPYGTYTDTAEYTDMIGECTNLSVGYFHAHSRDEFVWLAHVWQLLDSLIHLDQSTLVISRKAGDCDPDDIGPWWKQYQTVLHRSDAYDDDGATVIDGTLYDEDGYCVDEDEDEDKDEDQLYLSPEYAQIVKALKAETV